MPAPDEKVIPRDLELETGTAVWQSDYIPPLPDGTRSDHAAVTLLDGSVVVAGGYLNGYTTNTVWIWAPQSASWTAGPPLQELRAGLALAVCGNRLYAIGGWDGSFVGLDTVECLDVSVVCGGTQVEQSWTTLSCRLSSAWTTLSCRLSSARSGCAAVVVSDRHLVVMGGYHGKKRLDTVDLLDTQRNTVRLAPSRMTTSRFFFGASLVGGTIYAVGGYDGSYNLNTVECCDIVVDRSSSQSTSFKETWLPCVANSNQELDAAAPWRVVPTLRLSIGRSSFGLAAVGHCLVVAGGYDGKSGLKSVEVADTQKGMVRQLPKMGDKRAGCAAVVLHDGWVAVLGGYKRDSAETLLLSDPKTKLDVQQTCGMIRRAPSLAAEDDLKVLETQADPQTQPPPPSATTATTVKEKDESTGEDDPRLASASAEQELALCNSNTERENEELLALVETGMQEIRRAPSLTAEDDLKVLETQADPQTQPSPPSATTATTVKEKDESTGEDDPRLASASAEQELALRNSNTERENEELLALVEMRVQETEDRQRQLYDVQQVFISHTGQDPAAASFAGFLSDKLEDRHGISAFLDSEKLETGDAWMCVIEENAKKCQVFVCLVSPSYFTRYWCLHELDLAMAANRRIVPVYLEGNIPNASAFVDNCQGRLSANKAVWIMLWLIAGVGTWRNWIRSKACGTTPRTSTALRNFAAR